MCTDRKTIERKNIVCESLLSFGILEFKKTARQYCRAIFLLATIDHQNHLYQK